MRGTYPDSLHPAGPGLLDRPAQLLVSLSSIMAAVWSYGETRTQLVSSQEASVLFTDVVGFTALSEQLGAARVGEVLNAYLTRVAEVAHAHGATIDKFVGDAAMLVYGAPEHLAPEEQARRAVELARALIATTDALGGDPRLQIRVGIHTGEAVVGSFGSPHRSDYTVIGPAVNLASRLESACSPGRILVSADTAALLGEEAIEGEVGPLRLKGIGEPVTAYFVPS